MTQTQKLKEKKELLQPTNDYVFKRLFGYKGKENITKCLLELITKEEYKKVEVISQATTEKDILNDKVGILDIKVNTEREQFYVEMQVSNYKYIAERMLWYWAKMYSKSIKEKEQYNETKRTITVLFLKEDIENIKNIPKIHTIWHIREDEYYKLILTNRLEMHIISLKKLKEKNYKDIEDIRLINWLNFIESPEGKN